MKWFLDPERKVYNIEHVQVDLQFLKSQTKPYELQTLGPEPHTECDLMINLPGLTYLWWRYIWIIRIRSRKNIGRNELLSTWRRRTCPLTYFGAVGVIKLLLIIQSFNNTKLVKQRFNCWPADLLQYESSKENISSTLTTNGYFAFILHFKFYI